MCIRGMPRTRDLSPATVPRLLVLASKWLLKLHVGDSTHGHRCVIERHVPVALRLDRPHVIKMAVQKGSCRCPPI